jgi:hypothetical protein
VEEYKTKGDKGMNKLVSIAMTAILLSASSSGCVDDSNIRQDTERTINAANNLQSNQPTPTDINYSLERYNLIKRAYWVNGNREKANSLPCEIEKPLGYIVLFDKGVVFGKFIVDGKVSSLNSYLTPDSEYYEMDMTGRASVSDNTWLADVDGSYGNNDNGIFFFTTDGKYVEWSGDYLYSDMPFEVDEPVLTIKEGK